jgi:hypothetical protein
LKTVFLLTDKDLTRQRTGWPDVRINLSEIKRLFERPGWLIVEGANPETRIAIPNDVEGFNNLRSELIKHGRISESPRSFPFIAAVSVGASLFCWALVLLSRNRAVVESAGGFALVLLAWGSFSLGRLFSRSRKRFLLWAVLAFSWAEALWVIYRRLARM